MNILILGLGNILLSDEGVGVRVVEAFQERYEVPEGVEVIDGGTSGMDLIDLIERRDHLMVIDAVRTGDPPGTIIRLRGDEVPAFFRSRISPHQLGLSDVLAALKVLDTEPRGLTLIGIVPVELDLGLDLSPAITEKLPQILDMVGTELAALGIAVSAKKGSRHPANAVPGPGTPPRN
jgi:hydrogenase maturation protease